MGGGTDGILYNSDGNPNLLGTDANDGDSWLNAIWDNLGDQWNEHNGFAFAVSQLTKFQTPSISGVFVFLFVRANHRAFVQFHQIWLRCLYTFLYQLI